MAETWLCYRPLRISPTAPLRAAEFIRDPVEWTLRDVRDMLRLPMPDVGLSTGCNFAIADTLLAHVAGLATVFHDAAGEPRDRFIGLMRDYYPWHLEMFIDNNIDRDSGPPILYDVIRNPFAHNLGIDTQIVVGR